MFFSLVCWTGLNFLEVRFVNVVKTSEGQPEMLGDRNMWKVIAAIIVGLLFGSQELSASQPRMPIRYKVENPKHYVELASRFCESQFVADWKILEARVGTATDSVVPIYLQLEVPHSYSSLGIAYKAKVTLTYRGDSLLRDRRTWLQCVNYRSTIRHAERQKEVRLFVEATAIKHSIDFWEGPGHKLHFKSTTGDTLVYHMRETNTQLESGLTNGFTFQHASLLANLELYLKRWPVPQVTEFRENVGITRARLLNDHVFISSHSDSQGECASFSVMRSFGLITSFRLPNAFQWSTFPWFWRSHMAIWSLLPDRRAPGCQMEEMVNPHYTYMSYQQNSSPRAVYVMLECSEGVNQIASVIVGGDGSVDFHLRLHDPGVLDSLDIRVP